MRVIAGTLKGRRLQAPPEGETRVRPTSDRAREALFSILERWGKGPCVDLFAGTGAVALEASSRGWSPVVCVERGPVALKCLEANLKGSPVRALRLDVQRLKADGFRGQALVFADPPYDQAVAHFGRLAQVIRPWMASDGLLVWETDSRTELPRADGWELVDRRDYGAARFHFLEPR